LSLATPRGLPLPERRSLERKSLEGLDTRPGFTFNDCPSTRCHLATPPPSQQFQEIHRMRQTFPDAPAPISENWS